LTEELDARRRLALALDFGPCGPDEAAMRHEAAAVLANEPGAAGKTVGLIALTAIRDDPRVRRQGEAFRRAGWNVVAIGLDGGVAEPPDWPIVTPGRVAGPNPWLRRVARMCGSAAVRLTPAAAEPVRWSIDRDGRALHAVARRQRVDLWLANDWNALPIVRRLVREQGVPFVYDTHELACEEFAQRRYWRLVHRPMVIEVERRGLAEAALATCVSEGIAEHLQRFYRLPQRPLVVRNMPAYEARPFRPTGEAIEVLYHGIVSPGRGLEACIRSLALWRPEFRFTIRGPVTPAYRTALMNEAVAAGVAARLRFAPPVPVTEIVAAASASDVGLFALPAHSQQNRYALPNKIFEYMMAGLALCISDLPEMVRILEAHRLGVPIRGMEPAAIAAAVNALDRSRIDGYKRNALAAAKELNWEAEGIKLVAPCATLVRSAAPGKQVIGGARAATSRP
jgi:glycosyltransferase involved in cell wall biosynthesis